MREIYRSRIWKNLVPAVRAYLIPVIEGIRIGGQIELPYQYLRKDKLYVRVQTEEELFCKKQRRILLFCLEKLGLKFKRDEANENFYVSWDELVLEKLWSGQMRVGDFLGYPKCCQDAFFEGCEAYLKGKQRGPADIFFAELRKATEAGVHDGSLFFAFHVPCGLDCKESLGMASSIRKVLEENDPEAARHFSETRSGQHL